MSSTHVNVHFLIEKFIKFYSITPTYLIGQATRNLSQRNVKTYCLGGDQWCLEVGKLNVLVLSLYRRITYIPVAKHIWAKFW
jgi:hypothetical protein